MSEQLSCDEQASATTMRMRHVPPIVSHDFSFFASRMESAGEDVQ